MKAAPTARNPGPLKRVKKTNIETRGGQRTNND